MAKLHFDENNLPSPRRPRRQKTSRASRKVSAEFGLYPCLQCGREHQLTKEQYESGKVCLRCFKGNNYV